ncbi:hypothetical protein PHYPSEUDO_005281 [Phytophthora pseudosyringae]|uniref:Uncharacterized protein n=1 Tax=Phytophthora pseudosyringae TaxID=221518 RepID=A0A8T1WBC2_9STRA|nr:hypothetical protein PHYPSEUDO_005281 [Phytophthora pseudosyringae]
MEPSFVANPYVQASAPSSHKIREILDREEASYEAWRKTRKPVRLPHASLKLNSPLETLVVSRRDSNHSKSTKAIKATLNSPEADSGASSDAAGQSRLRSQSVVASRTVAPSKFVKRKDALVAGGFTRSLETFPTLTAEQHARQKQVQFGQASDHPNKLSDGVTIPSIVPRKATRRKFQQYLHDFHSRQVFSFAKSEAEEFEYALKREDVGQLSNALDADLAMNNEGNSSAIPTNSSKEYAREESLDRQSVYLLSGLGFLSGSDYDAIFEIHWRVSEAEKIVRDAVDRKRIPYAVASERRTGTGTVTAMGEGLFEIPSRFRLLEDLNVQCVDSARFGLTDTPLKRESLIDFLINVARMMSVKTLVHEHFGIFAQIQDVDHFRTIFLRKSDAFANHFHGGGLPRRLRAIIEVHKINLANFFEELVSAGAIVRSGGGNDRAKGQPRQRVNGIVCTQFLSILQAISLVITRGTTTAPTSNAAADGEGSGGGPAWVDEVRAVRIFLSCLPMATIDWNESAICTTATTTTTVSSNITSTEPRELTLSQFIEALLRVAFTWKELQICHGGFDVCPDQMTSDRCRCTIDPAHFAFDVFDDAVEEIFARIHAYRLKRIQDRTSMKSMKMKSHRSLYSLVAMSAVHRAPARLLPVEVKPSSNDAGT